MNCLELRKADHILYLENTYYTDHPCQRLENLHRKMLQT